VVIPAYNAEHRIVDTLRKMRSVKEVGEVVVVDDGSKDNTAKVARRYADRVVSYKPNHGKGYAMRKGAAAAKGDVVCFIDDAQFEPKEIPRLLRKMKSDNLDMVIGARDFSRIPSHRKITNYGSRFAILLGTGAWVKDALSGFRVIDRKRFLELGTTEDGYGIEVDTNFRALNRGLKVGWVPVTVHYNEAKTGIFKSANRSFKQLWRESSFNAKTVLKIWLGVFR